MLAAGYGAGLATGLSHLTDPVFVGVLLVLLAFGSWQEWWFAVLPALALGLVAGNHARLDSRNWCAARLPLGEHAYRLRVIDPGEGTGRATILTDGCTGTVLARWPRDARVPAGAVVKVSARWEPADRPLHRPDGMLLIGTTDSLRTHSGIISSLRNHIVVATRRLFGPRAPLANALLAGWRGELDPDLRAAFASAGLMHLLAISGLHIALLAGWVLLSLRLARVSRHRAECAAALAALGYTAFLGWPVAAVRASLLLLLVAVSRWRQRQVQFAALLGASVLLVLVVDPWAAAEPGLWLSIAGLSGVVAGIRWSEHALGSRWWVGSLAGSTGAVLSTAPIAAAVFGQVAPVGVVLNLAGMPLLVALLPALFGSVTFDQLLPFVSHGMAASSNGLLALLEMLARVGSAAPGNGVPGGGGWSAAWPWLAALLAAVWITGVRNTAVEATRRLAWVLLALLTVGLVRADSGAARVDIHGMSILFADVGQGDATLIRTPAGHWIEVDAGPIGEGRDAGRRVIAPLLVRQRARRIDLFVLSHAHRDHVGGGTGVLDRFPVSVAIEPGELFADSAYENWLAALSEHHSRWRAVKAGSHWTIDGVSFRVLHPPDVWLHEGEDLNEDSLVLEITFGEFRALLMGDAGLVAEAAMSPELRTVNVLKVGHHGSRTASGSAFLAGVRPQVAIISVGRNNYGHPSPEALARLDSAGARPWRTDQEGTVSVVTDGHTFTVKGARSSATFDARH